MADYQRMISYLYVYENGIKKDNVGFVRIECYRGQCKFTLQGKADGKDGEECRFYLLSVQDGLTRYEPFGEGAVQNRILQMQDVRSGEPGNLAGLLALFGPDYYLCTIWSEEDVSLNNLRELTGNAEEMAVPAETEEIPAADEEMTMQEDRILLSEPEPEEYPIVLDAEPIMQETEQEIWPETEAPESTDGMEEAAIKMEMQAESAVPEAAAEGEQEEPPLKAAEWKETVPAAECPFPEVFRDGMPMDPFNNAYRKCVRIRPEQISLMPETYWPLANSSFVLHGFYGYKHLLLCLDGEGRVWFGVPGIFHPKESRMARMMGFPRFQPIDQGSNRFGYWMRQL